LVWRLDRYRNGFMRRCGRLGSEWSFLEARHLRNAFKVMPVKAPQGCSSD
jgi:hypothetical protein